MRRWHNEAARTRLEHIKHLRQAHGWPKKPVECICDLQVGRFRKVKGMGCSKRNCICKWGKYDPTKQELIAEDRFREFMAEMGMI